MRGWGPHTTNFEFLRHSRQGVGPGLKPQQNRNPCYGNSPPQNFHLPLGHPPVNNQPEDGATTQLLQIPRGVHLHRQPRGTHAGIGQVGNTLLFHNTPTPPAHPFGIHSLGKRPTHPSSFLPPHGTPPGPELVGSPPGCGKILHMTPPRTRPTGFPASSLLRTTTPPATREA